MISLSARHARIAAISAIAASFVLLRTGFLLLREPFFDELFTAWLVPRPLSAIVEALKLDSGPPLYYFVVHLLGITAVPGARAVSLLCAVLTLVALAFWKRDRVSRLTAGALLTVFPAAVLFAADARAYALCALFVTVAILLVDSDHPLPAALALTLAAYSHYYGALFIPLLLMPPAEDEDAGPVWPRPSWLVRLGATGLAAVLFAPGLWLAFRQPREATSWMPAVPRWPEALLVKPPEALAIASVLLLVAAAVFVNRYTAMAAVPVALVVVLAVAGRPIYLPLRFEAVLAVPLILGIAASLERWDPWPRRGLLLGLLGALTAVTYLGLVEHSRRPTDPYRAAAKFVAKSIPRSQRVIATGYLYLETVMNGRPDAEAFPEAQADHPGWRARLTEIFLFPKPPFVWIGERGSPEGNALARQFQMQKLYENDRAIVARVEERPVPGKGN